MQDLRINTEMPLGVIRQLRPSDLPKFREHLLRLDVESRRDRFNGPSNDAFVAAYADRAFRAGTTVIGYVEGDEVLGAAELHEIEGEGEPTGEIAFSVEQVLQHRGIGSKLFQRLIWHAHALGYTQLRVTTHPQNQAMKRLASRFNARLRFEGGETVGLIELEPVAEIFAPQVMPQPQPLAA
ncbi:MAG: GNAT family N-acetyltransferase [Aliihoeflea sp.]|uniref:GNAT family N-acetyltransferase n=1 Tax=Aliihoeflea sp. TaxID=2608088 RepID=UPI004033961E